MAKTDGDQVVYLVRARTLGLIKIGVASDLRTRMANLQVGSPDQLDLVGVIRASNARDKEMELHGWFRKQWSHGEWFRPCRALEQLIADNSLADHQRWQCEQLRGLVEPD
jgi:hypothetical protein